MGKQADSSASPATSSEVIAVCPGKINLEKGVSCAFDPPWWGASGTDHARAALMPSTLFWTLALNSTNIRD